MLALPSIIYTLAIEQVQIHTHKYQHRYITLKHVCAGDLSFSRNGVRKTRRMSSSGSTCCGAKFAPSTKGNPKHTQPSILYAKCKPANSKAWLATGEKKTATAKHEYGCAVSLSVCQYVHEVRPVRVHKHVPTPAAPIS